MSPATHDEALADLDTAVGEFGRSVSHLGATRPPHALDAPRVVRELTREWERVNRQRLPMLGEGDGGGGDDGPRIPLLPPPEVLARWRDEGTAWVGTCSRLDLRSMLAAAEDATVGPVLLMDIRFWRALKARIRDRQADQVLNTAFFLVGERPWITEAIRARAGAAPTEVSPWWVAPGPTAGPLASAVARMAATATFGEVLGQLGLPDALPESFLAAVARASQATQAAELAALLKFLDRGAEMGNRAVTFESTREWVRRATQVGARFPRERLALAELLRGRIGEIAAGRDDARWAGIEEERGIVRTWLIGEIFRVLFSHLVPDGPYRHQTEPRRTFWSRYDQSVEKIWLLICDDHRDRLDGDEAVAKLKQHGLLEVLRFTGQREQDGLWMQLRSSRGEQVTILEGNANTSIRICPGAISPPIEAQRSFGLPAHFVRYAHAHAMMRKSSQLAVIPHHGYWQSLATDALYKLSIFPRGTR